MTAALLLLLPVVAGGGWLLGLVCGVDRERQRVRRLCGRVSREHDAAYARNVGGRLGRYHAGACWAAQELGVMVDRGDE